MTKAVKYENSETGFGSLRIVKGVDRLIYINNTDTEEGHRFQFYQNIQSTLRFIYGYLFDLLDLEVKP